METNEVYVMFLLFWWKIFYVNSSYKFSLLSDIVFLIFLYQRYIYRIDPKRVNEFGTSQEMWEQNGSAPTDASGEGNQETVTDGNTGKSAQEKKDDWSKPFSSLNFTIVQSINLKQFKVTADENTVHFGMVAA